MQYKSKGGKGLQPGDVVPGTMGLGVQGQDGSTTWRWNYEPKIEDGNKTVQSRGTATNPGQAAAAPRSPSTSGGPRPNARARTSHSSGSSSSSPAAAAPKPKKKPDAVKGAGRKTSQPRNPAMSNQKSAPKQDRGPEKARASAKKAATSSNTKSKKAAKSFWDQVKSGPSKKTAKRVEKRFASKSRN